MAITREEVCKIAELAKLHFSDAELGEFTEQFQHILDYIEKLKEVGIEGVEPTSHVSLSEDLEKNMCRQDTPRPSLTVTEALNNAPDGRDDHFLVPKVL
jgi:aspartyl-tRNA(Asn)/glutamyl-tRNA(Gln) amidotransferase subunit C